MTLFAMCAIAMSYGLRDVKHIFSFGRILIIPGNPIVTLQFVLEQGYIYNSKDR